MNQQKKKMSTQVVLGDRCLKDWGQWFFKRQAAPSEQENLTSMYAWMRSETASAELISEVSRVNLSDRQCQKVDRILNSFQPTRYAVLVAFYDHGMSEGEIISMFPGEVTESSVRRWLNTSREMVGQQLQSRESVSAE